jgi:oxygen-independent coproporphyrinogen-3 oxidase
LGRIHDVDDVYLAYAAARSAGFANINLDFMFGLPGQTPAAWEDTLGRALELEPDHLSLYSLIVEENTPLFHWVEMGQVDAPDDDLAAEHYELAMAYLAQAGYAHYEVSNWARVLPGERLGKGLPARASRHNVNYWLNGEWLGIGPGAHSHLRVADGHGGMLSRRSANRKPVAGYVRRLQDGDSVVDFTEEVDGPTSMGETMMLGLRLVEHGVTFDLFQRRYGLPLQAVYADELAELTRLGLLEVGVDRVRLSRRGLMLGNQVFARFIASEDGNTRSGASAQSTPAAHTV